MFLFFKSFTLSPLVYLLWLGKPFISLPESNLRHRSESELIKHFKEAKENHYTPRILSIGGVMVGSFILFLLTLLTSGYILWIFPIIALFLGSIDAVMILARYVYYSEEEKKATSRNELVVVDAWKDSSLQSLIERRNKDVQEFNKARY